MPEDEHERVALELVRSQVAAVLGHASAEAVPAGRAFKELGFDSLAAVELRNRLQDVTGLRLASSVVFDYPTAAALAGLLLGEVGDRVASAPARGRDGDDAGLRETIASIPLTRLREAGLVEVLLRLADLADGESPASAPQDSDLVYAMDVESLVQRARESARSVTAPDVGAGDGHL